jgi:hypothetical protein
MPHRLAPPRWVLPVTIAWVSFVAAGVAEMVFFASFDPQVLTSSATFPFELSRSATYTLGFLLFWVLAAVPTAVVIWLLDLKPALRAPARDETP